MTKRTTNVEFITELMEFNSPLMQPFVLQAIEVYAKEVFKAKPEQLDNGLVSGQAWHDCARVALKALEERYKEQ